MLRLVGSTVGDGGFRRLPQAIQHVADPLERPPVPRLQLRRDLELFERLGQPIGGIVRLPELEMGVDVRGVELHGTPEGLDRLFPSRTLTQQHAELEVRVRIIVVGLHGAASFRFRLFQAVRRESFHSSCRLKSGQGQRRFAVDPFQVLLEPRFHGKSEKLRNLVRMQLGEGRAQ